MKLPIVVALVCVSSACGAAYSKSARQGVAAAGPATVAADPTAAQIPEQLVIEGTLTVQVDEIADVVPSLRSLVESSGGRIITEVINGAEKSWSAQLKLRIPPSKVDDVVGFLAKRGEILDKRIT